MVELQPQHLCLCAHRLKNKYVSLSISRWDIRSSDEKPIITRKAHNGEVYSLDFNQKSEFLLLSGGEDGDVNLWDVRNMSKKVRDFLVSFILSLDIMMRLMLSAGAHTVQFSLQLAPQIAGSSSGTSRS
jgi:WD40 repeat protein